MKHLIIAFVLTFLAPVAVQAATVTLSSVADTSLVQAFSGQNFGQSDNLVVERVASQNYSRSLLRFDLSSIPSGSTISSATLTLRPWSFTGAGNVDMNFYRTGAAWEETAVTWATQPALGDLIRTVTITDDAIAKTFDFTGAVQNWFSGAWENTGFVIVGEENSSKTYRRGFWSREGGGPPTLAVEYTPPAAPPPPPPAPVSGDTTPPTISNISADTRLEDGILAVWTTDEPTIGYVESHSPLTEGFGPGPVETVYTTNHRVIFYDKFEVSGNYTYRIVATDAAGNRAVSPEQTVYYNTSAAARGVRSPYGRLVKLACPAGASADHACRAVYYVDALNIRHVFPNGKVYASWFSDFRNVVTISETEMVSYALGKNVHYKPGLRMIKLRSNPKVYAVARGALLMEIATEAAARELYGADWNKKIDDLADAFWGDYRVSPLLVNSIADLNPYNETTYTSIDRELLSSQEG